MDAPSLGASGSGSDQPRHSSNKDAAPRRLRRPSPLPQAPPPPPPSLPVEQVYYFGPRHVPSAAPIPIARAAPYDAQEFEITHYWPSQDSHSHSHHHQYVPIASMAPSAGPIYGQHDPPHPRRHEASVGFDPRYMQSVQLPHESVWGDDAPPQFRHHAQFVDIPRGDGHPHVSRRRRSRARQPSGSRLYDVAHETFKLTLFHLLNACLGFAACSVVTTGASLGVSTLPMCCFGILVFRILFYVVFAFAQFDMMLGNYVAQPDQFMYAVVPPFDGRGTLSGYRLAPTLACFSPLSLMALLYFCSVKVFVAVLSSIALALFLAPPITFAVSMFAGYVVQVGYFGIERMSVQEDPFGSATTTVVLVLIGFALLHVVASTSLFATRFFVCERFTVARLGPFQALDRFPGEHRPLYPVAVVSYGAA